MTTPAPPALGVRDVQGRAADVEAAAPGAREFTGLAVLFNAPTTIRDWFGTYHEQIAPGAVEHEDDVKVFWRHGEVIGRITAGEDTDAGWQVTGRLSDTTLGRDAYALLRDGAIDRMSIGFEPVEHIETENEDGTTTITRTRVRVREVSLVPFPAYDGAAVEHVRTATPKENTMPGTATADALTPEQIRTIVTESTDELSRRLDVMTDRMGAADAGPAGPQVTFRSAAALMKAMAAGDTDALAEYRAGVAYMAEQAQERNWSPAGETTGDHADVGGWLGDLTRIPSGSAGLMSWFSSAPLPTSGMFLEYAKWTPDAAEVGKQAAQGNTLTLLGGSSELATQTVDTYGGYSRLSRQVVQRSSINVLNHTLRRQEISARRALRAGFHAAYVAAVASDEAGPAVALATADVDGWIDAIVDAAVYYDDAGATLDGLVVDPSTFKALAKLETGGGEKLMHVFGQGVNRVGQVNVPGLSGNVLNVPVVPDLAATEPAAAFANREALRSYTSPIATLSDENVTDLYNDYSVYVYASFVPEFAEYLVPVELPGGGGVEG